MRAVAFGSLLARAALKQLPELAAQEDLQPPPLSRIYVPSQHAKALDLDASVVVGMRGAGKSWWTAVLASDRARRFVAEQLERSPLSRITARVGFGLDYTEKEFPNAETLRALLEEGLDPLGIWRAVVQRHAATATGRASPLTQGSWRDRVRWILEHRDEANNLLTDCDAGLAARDQVLLVLFDAFDRLATDWDRVRKLASAALQVALELRSRRAIRLKFFVRPDLEQDREIWTFPDSSKLRLAKVDLAWTSTDLYGLVFMHLGNALEFGPEFRDTTARELRAAWSEKEGVHLPPSQLTRDPACQKAVVEALADRYMGAGAKRGTTYTWIPLHLADAIGRISPRSYLLAFQKAAEHTEEHQPEHQRALHYAAIQQGVVKASEVRVAEIAEDYPWVQPLLEAARGAVVPIKPEELSQRWSPDLLRRLERPQEKKLPPRRFTTDRARRHEALIDDLAELAVLYRTKDGRLNMPDIFRVGFGIRRKGGVKPPR